ncbi:unnamed protein product [Prorocentrum cordatum]|uniref:U-box domain-containing protein n=1 Tax=Prorocentrum cordatum TaxID=2364126 RepID=A0ABN9SWH9_9DINO|nr:unnamed protein product [Polarella glacialis]
MLATAAARQLARCCGGPGDDDASWDSAAEDDDPPDLLCPITGQLFVRPALLCGHAFERSAVHRWVERTGRHPVLQDIRCHVGAIREAPDLEALCRRFASSQGRGLRGGRRGLLRRLFVRGPREPPDSGASQRERPGGLA